VSFVYCAACIKGPYGESFHGKSVVNKIFLTGHTSGHTLRKARRNILFHDMMSRCDLHLCYPQSVVRGVNTSPV
jgi:hypothetical protein